MNVQHQDLNTSHEQPSDGSIAYSGQTGGSSSMGEFNLLGLFNILRKWWWLVALSTALAMLIAGLIVFRMTPVFLATSTLEIKQQEREILTDSDVERFVVDSEFFNTQVELLKSTSLAESVVDNLNLTADPVFVDDNGDRVEMRRAAISSFQEKLKVQPVGRSRLINVSFEHPRPGIAAQIANMVTETFITNNLERKFNTTAFARDFIQQRLATTKTVLELSERELAAYATDNELVTVRDSQGNNVPGLLVADALVTLDSDLVKARTARLEAQTRYNLTLDDAQITDTSNNETLNDLKRRYFDLNNELIEKSAIYQPGFQIMIDMKARVDEYEALIAQEEAKLEGSVLAKLKREYDISVAAERDLQQRVMQLKSSVVNIRDKSVEYNILKREVETNRTQYDALLQRLKEVSISNDIGSDLITIVDKAKAPLRPFKPNKLLALLISGFLGGLFGLALIYVLEYIDDSIKSPEDIKSKLGIPVMGVIPIIEDEDDISGLLGKSNSVLAEAYASLRTNILFSGPDGGPQVVHVTSTQSGEGKSVSALGLALRFAGLKRKTLLIDADLRLPTFNKTHIENIGLSGLLTSTTNPADHIIITSYPNLDLLIAGPSVPNPSEILSTYRMDEILDFARGKYEHIIVDSPPVMGLADAPVLSKKCDGTLVIIHSGEIRTPAVREILNRLFSNKTKILGAVLTKYKAPRSGYNYYQYNYGKTLGADGSASKGKRSFAAKKKQPIDI